MAYFKLDKKAREELLPLASPHVYHRTQTLPILVLMIPALGVNRVYTYPPRGDFQMHLTERPTSKLTTGISLPPEKSNSSVLKHASYDVNQKHYVFQNRGTRLPKKMTV